jgi:anaerobic selenocysteine-containing dehydrogenase
MAKSLKKRWQEGVSRRSFLKVAGATAGLVALSGPPLAALAETGDALASTTTSGVKVIRTMCRGCGKMECGTWVTVENGKAVKIEGDESNFAAYGNCCSKSQASLQAAYHPDRLMYPMKRTNPKGDDDPGWVRISWDEALQTSADKLNEIYHRYGYNSNFVMVGTSRQWSMAACVVLAPMIKTVNSHQAYQVCKGPRHIATGFQSMSAFSWQAIVDRPSVYVQWGGCSELSNYDDSARTTVDCAFTADVHIVVDPRQTNLGKEADIWLPLRPGTDGAMALGWLNVIVNENLYDELWVKRWTDLPFLVCEDIEPSGWTVMTQGGPEECKTKLLKESDIIEDGKPQRFIVYDKLNSCFTYFDAETGYWEGETQQELKYYEAMQKHLVPGVAQGRVVVPTEFNPPIDPALTGQFDVTLKNGKTIKVRPVWEYFVESLEDYDPDSVASITECDAELIRKAARTYATRLHPETGYGNGGIQYMLATEHSCNSIQCCRALDAIIGITGNFDTPAGHRGATESVSIWSNFNFGGDITQMGDPEYGKNMDGILGIEDIPTMKRMAWADSTAIWVAANEGTPYPLKGAICQSGDVLNMSNALYAWEGLKKLDFFLDLDLWHHPTTQLADILMPVQHWLEVNFPRASMGAAGVEGATIKCIEPPGEARYDPDIINQLGKALGLTYGLYPENPWPEYSFILDKCAEMMGEPSWDAWVEKFQKNGFIDVKVEQPEKWGTYRRYETGVLNNDIPGMKTNTLKQEIWSTILESYWPDGRYNLPTYAEPPEGPVAQPERAKEYPYILTTGRRIPVYFHSEHRQLPWCRELWPVPRMEINPEDAVELGVKQGDWVWIETERGKIRQCVDLYYGIRKGTVNCEHAWWLPEFKGEKKGFDLVHINCLVNKDLRDPICGSSYVRAYNVKVYKATPENSPFGNPVPCDIDGTPMIASSDDPRLKDWLPGGKGVQVDNGE